MDLFKGVYTALVTPFDENGKVDYNSLKKLLDKQIEANISGVVINSTTGEGPSLTKNEKTKIANFVQKYLKNRAKLIISVGFGGFTDVLEDIKTFSKYKPDAILLNLPCYIKPNFSGLSKFVLACINESSVPIILYYVPSRSGQFLNTSQLLSLINLSPKIIGLKFADSNLAQLAELAKTSNKIIFCGEDSLLEEFLKLGATASISVASNAFPKVVASFMAGFKNEDSLAYLNFIKIKAIIKSLFLETNPILIKHLLNLMGFNVGSTRLPLDFPKVENKNKIKEELFKLKQQNLV